MGSEYYQINTLLQNVFNTTRLQWNNPMKEFETWMELNTNLSTSGHNFII